MPRTVRRPLLIGVSAVALTGAALAAPATAAPAPSSEYVTLVSGTGPLRSAWEVTNFNGLGEAESGGGGVVTAVPEQPLLECPYVSDRPEVAGLGVDDAEYDVDDTGEGGHLADAFDYGLIFTVDGQQVVAPESWDVESDTDGEGSVARAVTAGPVRVGGVDAVVESRALRTQQVLRSTVWLTNPGAQPMTVPFEVASNVGSDEETFIVGSSSGDDSVTEEDRWVATSGSSESWSEVVVTHVLGGPGAVIAPPETVTRNVFDCYTTDGIGATFLVTIPAGATRGLMFFDELAPTPSGALASAERFNEIPAPTDELVSDLDAEQRAQIVNWAHGSPEPEPEPSPQPSPAPNDVTKPTSRVSSAPAWSRSGAWTVAYEATDTGDGVREVQLWAKRPGDSEYVLAATDPASELDGRFPFDAAGEGGYEFYTVATDRAGNTEAAPAVPDATTTVDTTAPNVAVRMGKARPVPFDLGEQAPLALRMRVSEPVTTSFVVRRHGETVRTFGPDLTAAGVVVRAWNGRADGHRVEDGRYTLVMRATDFAGNRTVVRTPVRITR